MDLRTIERELVDQHHRSLSVWRLPQSAVVWGVLRHLGQVPREFQSPGAPDASLVDFWRVFDQFKRGAAQAVRWAAESEATEYDWLPENEQVLEETLELLNWAADYARLAAHFIAWTRKAINAEIDTVTRRVRFTFDGAVETSLLAASLRENERSLSYPAFAPPVSMIQGLLALDREEDWLSVGQWPNERPKLRGHAALAKVTEWARQVVMPELNDSISLGPVDLSDLRRFWAAIWLVSASYAIHEDDLDRRTRHTNDLPSAVLCMSREDWIARLAAAVGSSRERITAILDLLTFDPGTLHSSITSHVFVASRSGLVFLCPRLVFHCDPRGLVGWILNARPQLRELYGGLNQHLQHHWIEKLGNAFRTAGWSCWTEPRLRAQGAEIMPDIVASDRDCQFLIADFKHTTLPIEPRQISDRLKSFAADCDQMRRYQTVLCEHPEMLTAMGRADHPELCRIALIYRWPLSIPYPAACDVVVFQAEPIIRELSHGANTIQQLLAPRGVANSARLASGEIRVGEWTFETPGIKLSD
jgi:hypothetical protein